MADYDKVCKIVVLGNSGVGKSSFLHRLVDNVYNESHNTTIGVDFFVYRMVVNGKKIKLQIWDTAGQEQFKSIVKAYYRNAQGVLLMYDVTHRKSFNDILEWLRDLEDHNIRGKQKQSEVSRIILIGNKNEQSNEHYREVSREEGLQMAMSNGLLFNEISCKTDRFGPVNAMKQFVEQFIEEEFQTEEVDNNKTIHSKTSLLYGNVLGDKNRCC